MSDTGRKDMHDKVKEAVTPNVMKSDTQKAKEGITDTADRVAREVLPDTHKSGTQEAADKVGRGADNTKHDATHETVGDKVKHALGMDKTDHSTSH